MYTPEYFITHVKAALWDATRGQSKLTPEILAMEGFSGHMTRHFYNNLCSIPHLTYLEVGSYKGSTLISALYGNQVSGFAIDNWSEFNGPKEEFHANVQKYIDTSDVYFRDQDAFTLYTIPDIDIYLYDGNHSYDSHKKAITHFAPFLKPASIVIVDDWNWSWIREATLAGFQECPALKIEYCQEIRHTIDDTHTPQELAKTHFHNGMAVFVVSKCTC